MRGTRFFIPPTTYKAKRLVIVGGRIYEVVNTVGPRPVVVGGTIYEEAALNEVAEVDESVSVTPSVTALLLTGVAPTAAVSGAVGWTITDVDTDEIISDGQVGVICTVTNGAVSGKRIFLAQGANWVEQEVTGETTTTVTINVSFGGVLSAGAATLHGWNPL